MSFTTIKTLKDLGKTKKVHAIVFDMAAREFRVYDSMDAHKAIYDELVAKEGLNWHETIIGTCHQRIKFDIDCYAPEDGLATLKALVAAICETYFASYLKALNEDLIYVCTSHGPAKFSAHIVIDTIVADYGEAQAFSARVQDKMDNSLKCHVDWKVNKSSQNFRLPLASKDERQKRYVGTYSQIVANEALATIVPADVMPFDIWLKLMIVPVGEMKNEWCPSIKREKWGKAAGNKTLKVGKVPYSHIEHLAKTDTAGCYIRNIEDEGEGNWRIDYCRYAPSHCRLCDRVHDRDNTPIVRVVPFDENSVAIYFNCRRADKGGICLGQYGGLDDNVLKSVLKEEPALIDTKELTLKLLADISNKDIYCDKALKLFPRTRTLCVHAPMGMGKTKALREHLNKHFMSKTAKVHYISFRRTFAGHIKERFPEFTLYSDVNGDLTHYNKLIVQVESLFRLKVAAGIEPPKLLVLDECESIFEQFQSSHIKNLPAIFAIFGWLFRNAKEVILMDANMSDRTLALVKQFRGDDGLVYQKNMWQAKKEMNFQITTEISVWVSNIRKQLEDNKRIVIVTSSLKEAESANKYVQMNFPDAAVLLYTSKTNARLKKQHFEEVERYWKEAQVVIYTPTISAGVSFEAEHFDCIFGYFINVSCNVETCIQMLGRVRNVKDRTYYLCLQAKQDSTFPTTTAGIERSLKDERSLLYGTNNISFQYSPEGHMKVEHTDYYYLWLENCRMRNYSLNNFVKRFVAYLRADGATLSIMEDVPIKVAELMAYDRCKTICIEEEAAKVSASEDIDEERAKELEIRREDQNIGLEENERLELEKYSMRRHYDFADTISSDFAQKYGRKSQPWYHFYRLKQLVQFDTVGQTPMPILDVLNKLREKEKRIYEGAQVVFNAPGEEATLTKGRDNTHYLLENEIKNLSRQQETTFVATLALIMQAGGIKTLKDLDDQALSSNWILSIDINVFRRLLELCAMSLKKGISIDETPKSILRAIKVILGNYYGIKVTANKYDQNLLSIVLPEHFAYHWRPVAHLDPMPLVAPPKNNMALSKKLILNM